MKKGKNKKPSSHPRQRRWDLHVMQCVGCRVNTENIAQKVLNEMATFQPRTEPTNLKDHCVGTKAEFHVDLQWYYGMVELPVGAQRELIFCGLQKDP